MPATLCSKVTLAIFTSVNCILYTTPLVRTGVTADGMVGNVTEVMEGGMLIFHSVFVAALFSISRAWPVKVPWAGVNVIE